MIDTIEGIKSFGFLGDSMVIQKSDNSIKYKGRIIDSFSRKVNFISFKDFLFVFDNEGEYLIVDSQGNVLEKNELPKTFFRINSEYIGVEYYENESIQTGIIDDPLKAAFLNLSIKKYGSKVAYDNGVFAYLNSKKSISFFYSEKKEERILNLSTIVRDTEDISFFSFAGTYEGRLVTTLSNGGILNLDMINSNVIDYFPDAKIRSNLFPKTNKSSVFWGLNFDTFVELDLLAGKLSRKIDLKSQLTSLTQSNSVKTINTAYKQKEMIYFIADTDIVGVFDSKREEIIDYYKFEFEAKNVMLKGGLENTYVSHSSFYCLDSMERLHQIILKT